MTSYVATLIAGTGAALSDIMVQSACQNITSPDGPSPKLVWLEQAKAADLFFMSPVEPDVASIRQSLGEAAVDLIVQPVAHRRKKLLVADMESTMIEQEMLDELAEMIGIGPQVANITARAMNGELDFDAALRERVGLLKGQPESLIEQAARRITPMPGAQALIAAMKAAGATCWLVSGGFTCFAEPVGRQLGFDSVHANRLAVAGGVITGEVMSPILDKDSKRRLLERAAGALQLSLADCLTIGDGANDVPMLVACQQGGGLGIAYHAKPKVRAVGTQQINHGDLSGLIYAQGIQPVI